MKFVFPCMEYEKMAKEYREEFYGSHINGSGSLWYKYAKGSIGFLQANRTKQNIDYL